MKRQRLTITLQNDLIRKIDQYIDGVKIRNRSHAIEFLISKELNSPIRKAIILAADQGIKFRPFTYEMPKCMLPVKGRPILEHIITKLRDFDIRDIYISVGYLHQKIESYFGQGDKFGVKITYFKQEKKNLGTGGALKNFESFLIQEEAFFLIYGDVLADIKYDDIVSFYYTHKSEGHIGVVALTTVRDPEFWGVAQIKGETIVNFIEKPAKIKAKSHLVSAGIYLLTPKIFSYITKDKKISLEKDILPQVVQKCRLSGYLFEGPWYDISTPAVYSQVLKEWE
jgi:NDP-sugar pyrophosphorylase family protein